MNLSLYPPKTFRTLRTCRTLLLTLHLYLGLTAYEMSDYYCKRSGKLYCALTCMLVNKSMDSLKKHLKGKSFLKAKGEHDC